ncbi:HAD-IIIA family hydrolase [Acidaminobacter sp. JC074]|uniref:HAD family hydrolase n=1 Tax=Acidaminobacter sp. JC074 TaxID=2530199 RepID=UPI001F0CFEBE|nr:HAD-IA family hydrolase [Acidaminobacter sp. JC074]MCH4886222.1 HAD-IIIA family hydrolase [Acidaminobacter sp. JC074]
MKKKALLFDLFFTLIVPKYTKGANEYDLLSISENRWNEITAHEGLYKKRASGKNLDPESILEELVGLTSVKASESMIRDLVDIRIKRFKRAVEDVEPEVIETLEVLKNRGYKLAIVSNADSIDVMHWQTSPLAGLFDETIFSYEVGCLKPDPMIYQTALERLGCKPDECIFIGDGGSDELRGAKTLGMTTLLTRHFINRYEEGHDYHAYIDMCISRTKDLLTIL